MRVTAVIKDPPSNTHLRLTLVVSGKAPFSTMAHVDSLPSTGRAKPWSAHTYLGLRPGQPGRADLSTACRPWPGAHMPGYVGKNGTSGLTMPARSPSPAIHSGLFA